MKDSYRRWMYDWETRMTSRDNNRVVRPLEWGNEFVAGWPLVSGMTRPGRSGRHGGEPGVLERGEQPGGFGSDKFYAYRVPVDFRLEHRRVELFHTGSQPPDATERIVRTVSALHVGGGVAVPGEQSDECAAGFGARQAGGSGAAAMERRTASAANGLCQIFNMLGISALRMSMPSRHSAAARTDAGGLRGAVALLRGSVVGAVGGFCAGLVVDTATLGTLGLTSLVLTLAGYWIGRYGETTGRDRAHAPFLSVAVVTVLYQFGLLVVHFVLGESAPAGAVVRSLVPAIVLNLILTAPIYALARRLLRPVNRDELTAEVQLLG